MGQLKWYRRYPSDALGGMQGLTLEERGAYNTVLDLIYDRADNLPDDDRFVSGWCGCDVRVWRRIKARLVSLGKLTIEGGLIRNAKATCEVTYGLSRGLSCSEAGRASAAKRWGKPNENNVVALTTATTTVVTNQNQSKKEKEKSIKRKPVVASAWDGSQLPEEWVGWAIKNMAWSRRQAVLEGCRFLDSAMAKRRTYVDWFAAWRQWCRSPYQKTVAPSQEALTL